MIDNFLFNSQTPWNKLETKYIEMRNKDRLGFKDLYDFIKIMESFYVERDKDFFNLKGKIGNLIVKHVLDELNLNYSFDEFRNIDFIVIQNSLIEVKNWGLPKGNRNTFNTLFKEKVTNRFEERDPNHEKSWYLVLNRKLWEKVPTDLDKPIREECGDKNIHLIRMPRITPRTSKNDVKETVQDLKNDIGLIFDENRNFVYGGVKPWEINSRIQSKRDGGRFLVFIGKSKREKSSVVGELLKRFECDKCLFTKEKVEDVKNRYNDTNVKVKNYYQLGNIEENLQKPIFVFENVGEKINEVYMNYLISERKETGVHYLISVASFNNLRNSINPKLIDGMVVFELESEHEIDPPLELDNDLQDEFSESLEAITKNQFSFINLREKRIAEKRGHEVNLLKKFLKSEDTEEDYRFYEGMSDLEKKKANMRLGNFKGWNSRGGGDKKSKIISYLERDENPHRRDINEEIAEHYGWDYGANKGYIKKVKSNWNRNL